MREDVIQIFCNAVTRGMETMYVLLIECHVKFNHHFFTKILGKIVTFKKCPSLLLKVSVVYGKKKKKKKSLILNPWQFSVQFSSVTQLYPTLCDPMNRSTPGLPVHHQLPEFTQTHVHRVGDAIQPSHPLSSPSLTLNPSQHQSLFQ